MTEERRVPRLIPVLDVLGGVVVRAVAGRRAEYRPVESSLTASCDPVAVASAMLAASGANELYVADLDALTGSARVSPAVHELVQRIPIPTWLDAGVGRLRVRDLPALPHVRPVVGFETCGSPELLTEAMHEAGRQPIAFSIDLHHGRLLGNWQAWGLSDAGDTLELAHRAVALGVRTLIVLDLARVGTGTGCGTDELLRSLRAAYPNIELIAGGGVTSWANVDVLGVAGASAVLVASALHAATLSTPRPTNS